MLFEQATRRQAGCVTLGIFGSLHLPVNLNDSPGQADYPHRPTQLPKRLGEISLMVHYTVSSRRRILARLLLIPPQPQERSAYIPGLTPASSLFLSFVE